MKRITVYVTLKAERVRVIAEFKKSVAENVNVETRDADDIC